MWRDFVREWLMPPALRQRWTAWRTPRTQKFWCGEPLDAAPAEARYFAAAEVPALTLTRQDDSRSAGRFASGTFQLPLSGDGEEVQIAVAADRWTARDRLTVSSGAESIEHSGLAPGQWLDIRLARAGDDGAPLRIASTTPIYCTMPRTVRGSARAAAGIRHVLVMVLDGLTPYLRLEGAGAPAAPNIERFFADGFLAGNGWASGEWTLPTTASFFTGLYTSRHRMYHPTRPTRPPERALLAEIVQAAGFHTFALSTANRLTPAFGSHRGFDRFVYHWPYPGRTAKDYDPARWCDEILGHLDAHRHDKTFTYVQFPDTHPAWNIGPLTRSFNLQRRGSSTGHDLDALRSHPDAARQGRLLNAIRLHDLDRLLEAVFRFVEREIDDSTLVVLTADHGTPWFPLRPKRPADEPYLVDQRLHIEWRMRGPGIGASRFDGLCSPNIDLMPTLLARLGIDSPSDIDGRDVLSPAYSRETVISESAYGGVYELAVRDGRTAYIEKFPMDDDTFSLRGPRSYARCFPVGTDDYSSSVPDVPEALALRAREHRRSVGLER